MPHPRDNRPIRLTQCCTQFKPFGNKTFCFRNFHTFKWECHIIMQIQYKKNLHPGRFELGTTLSWPNRSIILLVNYDSCWHHQMSVHKLEAWQAKWAVFKIPGFVCKRLLPFFPTPSPLFYLSHFSPRSLTLVPHSLLLNRTKTLATQASQSQKSDFGWHHLAWCVKG